MKLFKRPTVALAIEGQSARVMSANNQRVERWGRVPLGAELIRSGLVVQPEAVGVAIRGLMEEQRLPRRGVAVSMTGQRSVWRIISIPKANRELTEKAILREASKQMPISLESVYLSWQPIGEGNGFRQYFVLGVPRDILDVQMEAFRYAGVQPSSMDLKPLALIRAVNRRDALIVDIEPSSVDIVICTGGIPALMRTLELEPGQGGMEEGADEIAREIERNARFYNQSHKEAPIPREATLYLTGELADDPVFVRMLEARAGRPVEFASPALGLAQSLPLGAFMVNIGLILKREPRW